MAHPLACACTIPLADLEQAVVEIRATSTPELAPEILVPMQTAISLSCLLVSYSGNLRVITFMATARCNIVFSTLTASVAPRTHAD